MNLYNFVFSSLAHLIGNSIDDVQTAGVLGGNPNTNGSTNPTHSQLAKDHDNHPFHVIAARLAKQAVKQVGIDMAAYWSGDTTANPAKTAASYLVHPNDSVWQDNIVANWARQNSNNIVRGESATEWEALEKAHKQEVLDIFTDVQDKWDYMNKYYKDIYGEKNQVKSK